MADKNISDDIDIEYLVDLTGGMSAVEIRTLANEAGVYAGYDRSEVIKMDHIVRAFAGRASNSMIDNHIDNKERAKVTAYHEAGHAVISDLLRRGSVGFVFLGKEAGESEGFMSMARGNAGVGVNHYRHDILTGLGGRAATELVFGRPDRGAGADLSKVISAINCELTWLCVDGIELAENRSSYIEPSMARRNSIDKLSRDKLKAYYAETKAMLEDNRKLLDMVAGALEEKGYLLSEDISRIRNEYESERSGR